MPRLTKAEWHLVQMALEIVVSGGEAPGVSNDFAELADRAAKLLETKFHYSIGGERP